MSEQEFKKARALSPKKATSYRKILKLKRTFACTPRSWFHLGHAGDIHICNQRIGNTASGQVRMSRAEFEKFVRFYTAAQKAK